MNHDATHCLDYKKGECPEECYRAQLTEELIELKNKLRWITWASFKSTEECRREDER